MQLLFGSVRPWEEDVLPDRAFEEKVVLQHHAKELAVARKAHFAQVLTINGDGARLRCEEGRCKSCDGALAGSGCAHQRGHASRRGIEADVVHDFLAFFISEGHVVEADVATNGSELHRALIGNILGLHVHDLLRTIQSGEGFGELAANVAHLHNGCDHETEVEGEGEELTKREVVVDDLVTTHAHDAHAGEAEQEGAGTRDEGGGGEALLHVLEEPLNTALKALVLLFLGIEALDHAHAVERFGEATGDFSIDHTACAEDGPDLGEGLERDKSEDAHGYQRVQRHPWTDVDQQHQRCDGRDGASDQLH